MGADYNQCLKAFHEAESYDGPSIIIAYAPCINHGIKGGMGISMTEEKAAVPPATGTTSASTRAWLRTARTPSPLTARSRARATATSL